MTIIIFSIGLAMDCFAVSVSKGLAVDLHEVFAKRQHPWLMAVLFGLFQGGMPLIGYYAGTIFRDFFSRYAGIIALLLLGYIGGKMIWESGQRNKEEGQRNKEEGQRNKEEGQRNKEEGQRIKDADFSLKTLFILAIATSIDALATGVIFIPHPESLWLGISIIALGSFIFSIAGYLIGVFVGSKFKLNVELIGGLILIAIGLKIFIEGLCS
ncbi:MAG: manganese efflux pump MntP family protein [Paludibacteraceae bacterium]|nr:manganese efflux pump MntP family protein [Paludibacteraceae bacterium]